VARIAERLTPEVRYSKLIEELELTFCSSLSTNVIRCHCRKHGEVTLKVAHTSIGHTQMANEARFLSLYRSHHWPEFIATGQYGNQMWLMTHFEEGTPLSNLRVLDSITQSELLSSLEMVLNKLHQTGYIHGDVKPANILVTHSGAVKLIDLGSVLPINSYYADLKHSTISPSYSSINPHARKHHVHPQDDFFSLAVTVQTLYTAHPFKGTSILEYAKQKKAPIIEALPTRYQILLLKHLGWTKHYLAESDTY